MYRLCVLGILFQKQDILDCIFDIFPKFTYNLINDLLINDSLIQFFHAQSYSLILLIASPMALSTSLI